MENVYLTITWVSSNYRANFPSAYDVAAEILEILIFSGNAF